MNIILVHGAWADGSVWSKVIPLLQGAAHRVIAVHLPFHSLADDVGTVKRAIELVGSPTIVAGHSYGGMVITNAAYNNPNVKGLVYVAAFDVRIIISSISNYHIIILTLKALYTLLPLPLRRVNLRHCQSRQYHLKHHYYRLNLQRSGPSALSHWHL